MSAVLLDWFLWMGLWTLVLFVGVRALDTLLRRRIGPGWRALLYAVVLVRVLLPVRWTAPLGLASAVSLGAGPVSPTAGLPPLLVENTASASNAWPSFLALAYGVGALVLAVLWLRAHLRLGRAARVASTDGIVVAESNVGPSVVGLLRPCILLPRDLVADASTTALDWIVRHERAHVRRRDHLVLAAVQITTIVLWPLPAVWLAAARVRALLELACDHTTLEGAAPAERRTYQETLLMLATRNSRRVVPRLIPAFGGGSVSERIEAVSTSSPLPRLVQAAIVVAAAVVMTACAGVAADDGRRGLVGDGDVLLALETNTVESESDEPAQFLLESALISGPEGFIGDALEFAADDGELMARLQGTAGVRILNMPALIALEGQEATIFLGESKPGTAAAQRRARAEAIDLGELRVRYPTETETGHFIERGLRIQVIPQSNTDTGRQVHVRLIHVEAGEIIHELDQEMVIQDGKKVTVRIGRSIEVKK